MSVNWLCCQHSPSALLFQLPSCSVHPLFKMIMNHGNWLCCHISNPRAQGLTAEYVTVGRSSLLKGCTAGCPEERPVSCTASTGSCSFLLNERRSLTLAERNEDIALKIPKSSHPHSVCSWLLAALPGPHHHFPCVICLYQYTMLMTSSMTTYHSSLTSIQILWGVLSNIRGTKGHHGNFCLITYVTKARLFQERKMRTLISSKSTRWRNKCPC